MKILGIFSKKNKTDKQYVIRSEVINNGRMIIQNEEFNCKERIIGKRKVGEVPILYEWKEACCGCSACYAVCPQNAISMSPDEEGFFYPVIDAKVCIRCKKCIAVCPMKK